MAASWHGVCNNSSLTKYEKYSLKKNQSTFFFSSPELLFAQNRLENEVKGQAFVSQIRKHLPGKFNSEQQLALKLHECRTLHGENLNVINSVY